MAYLEWSDEMSIHVCEIDNDHRELVALVNRLGEAMLGGRGPAEQRAAIDAMLDYAGRHFVKEENYMRAFGYDGLAAHKAEHDSFTAKARELKERSDRQGFILTLEIVDYLRGWLVEHLMGTDKRCAAVFQEHGLR